ncbi:MAG: hypothetical protein AB7O26_02725 [Planctomycetaceae bacterium]
MDGLCWIHGGATIRLGDETVVLHALRLCDYALIESEMLRRRGNPFDLLRRIAARFSIPEDPVDDVLPALFQEVDKRWCRVSYREIRAWLDTWPGRLFGLWLSIRDANPARYTLEYVQQQGLSANWDAIERAQQLASAEDERMLPDSLFDATESDDAIPWSTIFRRLAAPPYSLSVQEVGQLTLRQLPLFLSDDDPVATRLQFDSAADFEAWRLGREDRVRDAVARLRSGLRWDSVCVSPT